MPEYGDRFIRILALLVAGLIGAWTARACHRAQQRGGPGSDAIVWAGLAVLFLVFAHLKLARGLGVFSGWGEWLRTIAREHHIYADRRWFQIAATTAIALVAIVLLIYGLIWLWDAIRRYRLAIGFAAVTVAYVAIRFVSLHEVDAWNAAHPWAPTAADLTAAIGASAVAIARLRQLREFTRPFGPD